MGFNRVVQLFVSTGGDYGSNSSDTGFYHHLCLNHMSQYMYMYITMGS